MEMTISLPEDPVSLDTMLRDAGLKTGGPTKKGASFWNAFQLCPYDARLIEKYGHAYQGSTSPALITGVLVHEGLAHWYLTYSSIEAYKPVKLVLEWAANSMAGPMAQFAQMVWNACTEAEHLIKMCLSRPAPPAPYNITALTSPLYDFPQPIIRQVEAPITYSGDFEYSARLDLVTEIIDQDGAPCVAVVDHKTMRTYKSEWADAFWQDLQFVGIPFLWNEVMVPQGFPPCRYVIANGIVKSPSHPSERFTRHIYPVRRSRIERFRMQMIRTWEQYHECRMAEEALGNEGVPFDLGQAWPQRWAACQSRRYGKQSVGRDQKEVGEFIPDGGRCHRFLYCLHDDAYSHTVTPAPVVVPLLPEPTEAPVPSLPAAPESMAPPREEAKLTPAATPTPEEAPLYPTVDDRAPGVVFRHPIPPDASLIVSMEDCSAQPIPLMQVPTGECVYIRGAIYWATATPDGGGRKMILPGKPSLVTIDNNTMVYLTTPVFKPPKKEKKGATEESDDETAEASPEVPEVDPRQLELPLEEDTTPPASEPEEAPAAPSEDPRNPVGRVVGQAAMAGVGIVPVRYLGSFNRAGKALYPNLTALWKEHGSPFYGAAMSGRTADSRRLQILSARSEGEYNVELKGDIGSVVWQQVEETIAELVAQLKEATK